MTLLTLDERRRAAFGRIGRKEDTLYEVSEHPDGTLVLTPVVVMTTAERDLLTGPAELRAALEDTVEGRHVSARPVPARRMPRRS
jgi:hypothetical protein